MEFTRDLRPRGLDRNYRQALALLQASSRTRIGHIDTGVAPHPALGYAGETPPDYLLIGEGRDFLSDDPDAPPISDLVIGGALSDLLTDYPDHGVKTLSVILSNTDRFRGLAPEVQVIPVRISDGPIFQDVAQRDNMGRAMDHLLGLDPVPRVISISMGNPGHAGLLQPFFSGLGQKPGFDKNTRASFDRAYEMGVIVVAAAGQVLDRIPYPARYSRTIAVGGYRKGRVEHYPPFDFDLPSRVDIWAQADGLNRAYARRLPDGSIETGYAEDEDGGTEKVSGTSYATPQVSAAAALWVEMFFHDLPAPGSADAWKTVEAFRHALRRSADQTGLVLRVPRRRHVTRPCLNVERLLGTRPVLPDDGAKASPAVRHANQA